MPNSAAISLIDHYDALVTTGAIERDPAQALLVQQLEDLALRLGERALASKGRALGWLFARGRPEPVPIKGLYIWGSVGRGKTMLMDMFFRRVKNVTKRRAHFHTFMADVHARIHAFRQQVKAGQIRDGDPIAPTARAIAAEATLLCFDEFAVTDIADAMILGRLFQALFDRGVVAVATSNTAPDDLFRGQPGRDAFLPFIAILNRHVDVHLLDSARDFRRQRDRAFATWHVPADARADMALDEVFRAMGGGERPRPVDLTVMGRTLRVPLAAGKVARFDFEALCGTALGAGDYLAIAERFHTVVLDAVPRLSPDNFDKARRFIVLVDTLYDQRVKLYASAAAMPDQLYMRGENATMFERTASRLEEMRSQDYLDSEHLA